MKGTNFDYFSEQGKQIFYEKEFIVSKLSDRRGMRLEGPKLENIVNTRRISISGVFYAKVNNQSTIRNK